jgi:hypothetical protein
LDSNRQRQSCFGRVDNLIDNIKAITGVEMEDHDKVELMEHIITAMAAPNSVVERRDFSTPESNYDIIYFIN